MEKGAVVFLISLPIWAFLAFRVADRIQQLKWKNVGSRKSLIAAIFLAMCLIFLMRYWRGL
jgi:hypothetical protein